MLLGYREHQVVSMDQGKVQIAMNKGLSVVLGEHGYVIITLNAIDRLGKPHNLFSYVIRPFSWLEIADVYKLGNETLVSTTLCPH